MPEWQLFFGSKKVFSDINCLLSVNIERRAGKEMFKTEKQSKSRAQNLCELVRMIEDETYKQKYMYGVGRIKQFVEEYACEYEKVNGISPLDMVEFRLKTAESIADKLEKKGYEISPKNALKHLSDLAGVRVICSSVEQVHAMEDFLCECEDFTIVRKKDYISFPKKNGYRSIHLIAEMPVPHEKGGDKIHVEIQLRTKEMHGWAQLDHRRFYKKLTK